MKKTDLTAKYNYNVIAISNKKPVLLGLLDVLDYYIAHQYEVITRRTKFDLAKAKDRIHIVEGLIKAVSVIDEVIKAIRSSTDRASSKLNLMNKFKFSDKQAEAIITLQLYRLSSTDITLLQNEAAELKTQVTELNKILEDNSYLKKVLINELSNISKVYKTPRLSTIETDMVEFVIEKKPIIKEDIYLAITRDGYVKRSSVKSFQASEGALPGYKSGDLIIAHGGANTADHILAFTNQGNYLYIPVFEMLDGKWKDEGKHISHLINIDGVEKIIKAMLVKDFREDVNIVLVSAKGLIKRTKLTEFVAQRYSRPLSCMNLGKDDELVGVDYADGDSKIVILTDHGRGVSYHESLVSVIGIKAGGVKATKLDSDSKLVGLITLKHNQDLNPYLLTDRGGLKIFDAKLIEAINRSNKPSEVFKYFKSVPHHAIGLGIVNDNPNILAITSLNKTKVEDISGNKITLLGKTMQAYFSLDKDEFFISFSDMSLAEISKKTKTFLVEPKVGYDDKKDEEPKNSKTIFDYLEDL
jgi:topoisomerase-4 subunit A